MAEERQRAVAKELFLAALEQDPAQREAWIDARCGRDASLCQLVRGLLQAHDRAAGFLGRAAADSADGNGALPNEPLRPGARIGAYRLRQVLGEGGFGVVFLAEQEQPIARTVAVKVLKVGMDSGQVAARFAAERQALALMDHPGIAKVLDAGATDQGRPYFVMEYVAGTPITEFCDARKLDLRTRLELFEQVCLAVQHAHQKGVIHRDIKPGNVLVTVVDGRPLPKVIDFGVAKATGYRLTGATLTRSHQIVGTPEYMSPEQVSASGDDIDTRSDVYSLGVLLYRLISGASPYDVESGKELGLAEWLRVICEDIAPRPSARIRGAGPAAVAAAAARATTPLRLARRLQHELDWIALKAIEKDRTQRFPTAYSLAKDIRRFLDGEPVEAGPPSALYRVRKFCSRHRAAVIAAITVLVLAIASATVSGVFAVVALRSRNEAQRSRLAAERQTYAASIYAAVSALNAHNSDAARRHLDAAPAALRAWEWRYLDQQVDRAAVTLARASGKARSLAFDATGERLACTWDDDAVLVFDAGDGRALATLARPGIQPGALVFARDGESLHVATATGALLRVRWRAAEVDAWPVHASRVTSLALSRDGSLLCSASWDASVRLTDSATGTLVRALEHPAKVEAAQLSADANVVAAATWDQTWTLWRARDGTKLATGRAARASTPIAAPARFPDAQVSALELSPDGTVLFSAARDGQLRAWDTGNGALLWEDGRHRGLIRDLAMSTDGKRLAAASNDRTVTLWNAATYELVAVLDDHDDDVRAVAFSPDARLLASASWDKSIKLWDARDGRLLVTLLGHTAAVYDVLFAPNGARLASYSEDRTVRLWDVPAACADAVLVRGFVLALAFARDGRLLAADVDGPVRVVDPQRGHGALAQAELEGSDRSSAVAVDPSGSVVATASAGASILLFEGERPAGTLAGHRERVVALAFSRDGRYLASASWDKTVRLWDVAARAEVQCCEGHEARLMAVAFDGDGTRVVTSANDGTARVFDAKTGREERVLWSRPGAWISALAVHPDGKRVAVDCGDRTIGVFDIATGERMRVLHGHAASVKALAWLPDGTRLVSAGDDRTVRLWDPESSENVATLLEHTRQVRSLAVTADGTAIASGDESGLIRIRRIAASR